MSAEHDKKHSKETFREALGRDGLKLSTIGAIVTILVKSLSHLLPYFALTGGGSAALYFWGKHKRTHPERKGLFRRRIHPATTGGGH